MQLRIDSLQKDQILLSLEENLLRKKLGKVKSKISQEEKTVEVLQGMELMADDAEWLLEKWYRLPLLDLTTCQGFKNDTEWIAKRLEISAVEAKEAIDKLEKYGFLTRALDGKVVKTHSTLRFPSKFSKSIIRNFHSMQMKRAMNKMNQCTTQLDFDKRLIVGLSVASNPQNMDKAKAILHRALYEAAELLQEGECTEVYQISLQLFPQTC